MDFLSTLRLSMPFWRFIDKIFGGVTNFQNRVNNYLQTSEKFDII